MLIPPKYFLTAKISQLLNSIEASREVINAINLPPEIEMNIRRQSHLKSSLFSARIEGSVLTLDDVSSYTSKDQKKVEVFNILKSLQLMLQTHSKDISIKNIQDWHQTIMDGLIEKPSRGQFRHEVSAIFNAAGIAIYMPPPPRQVHPFIERLLKYINSSKEPFVPTRAVIAHYAFEKIHPFLDGNGRVGRLLLQATLHKGGYGMKGLLSIEEYLDAHRSIYYRCLEDSENDITNYITFMLEAIAATAEKTKKQVLEKQKSDVTDFLLPRRLEILNIIRDHHLVTFDQVRRRFLSVNERTLRYDLKKLAENGFIRKRGITNGACYEAIFHTSQEE